MTGAILTNGPGFRSALITGIAACVGVLIACTGTWVSFAMFSVGGLDASNWGKVGIGIAVVSAILRQSSFSARAANSRRIPP